MLLCLVLGIIVGAANGVLIGVMNLPPFLATLCTCMITRGAGSLCSATPWPGLTQEGGWFHSIFKITVGVTAAYAIAARPVKSPHTTYTIT